MENDPASPNPDSFRPAFDPPPRAARPPASYTRLPMLIGVLLALVVLLYAPTYMQQLEYAKMKGQVRAIDEGLPDVSVKLGSLSNAFSLIAAKVGPSVVTIDTAGQVRRNGPLGPVLEREEGLASGVVVDPAGYIVTNNHVVEGATAIQVTLADHRRFAAEVLGTDPAVDLAVLKIGADGLIAASWGDSDTLPVGAWVLAIGNPYGLDHTVTFGIISAKDRRDQGRNGSLAQAFLQTDAAVNPGNSGGPLVDMAGKIVGINTAIFGQTYQGISFAVPSKMAEKVYNQLRQGQQVVHQYGYLGVQMAPLTAERARGAGLSSLRGALVVRVEPGSPAENAGLKAGDVVVEWDGQQIDDPGMLGVTVAQTKIGAAVSVTIVRQGDVKKLQVTVGQRPVQK